MKILVIGNGFDLEHGLPTTYINFLNFISNVKKMKDFNFSNHEKMNIIGNNDYVKEYLTSNLCCDEKRDIINELIELSQNNVWIDYFIDTKEKLNENWIDFEREIANVIKALDYMKKFIKEKQEYHDQNIKVNFILENEFNKIRRYISMESYSELSQKEFMDEIVKPLENDLKRLIRCLEVYLDDCVNKIEAKYKSSNIKLYDRVISFNYTNTYERIYTSGESEVVKYDYIHGKANCSKKLEDNDMVLGIDEYLDDEKKDREVDFITFKKYYQRIYKESKCDYKLWLDSSYNGILNKGEKHEIFIFGHSLDVTDKDILKEIILHENVAKVTIYYYDKETYRNQIANLVKVIGQDNLQNNYYGVNKRIFFKQQKKRKEYKK